MGGAGKYVFFVQRADDLLPLHDVLNEPMILTVLQDHSIAKVNGRRCRFLETDFLIHCQRSGGYPQLVDEAR